MLDSIKRFFKIYPIPIFVLLLVFIVYYSVFEILRKQEIVSTQPITEAESMQNEFVAPLQPQQNTQTQKNENHIPQKPIPTKQETPTQNTKTYITTKVRALNIRQEPNTTSNVLGTLTPDDSIEILETKGDWVRFQDINPSSQKNGWVMRRFLKEI